MFACVYIMTMTSPKTIIWIEGDILEKMIANNSLEQN